LLLFKSEVFTFNNFNKVITKKHFIKLNGFTHDVLLKTIIKR